MDYFWKPNNLITKNQVIELSQSIRENIRENVNELRVEKEDIDICCNAQNTIQIKSR